MPIKDRYVTKIFKQNDDKSFISITANFGYMEAPNVNNVIADIAANKKLTPSDDLADWVIIAGKERIIASSDVAKRSLWNKIRVNLYKMLSRNTAPAYEYFGLTSDLRLMVEPIPVKLQ
jgi:K+ transporter